MFPGCQSGQVFLDGEYQGVQSDSEWEYTPEAIERYRMKKPMPAIFRTEAPREWVEKGFVREKERQLTLF